MNQYWESKKLIIFWFSEWSWAAIYNWNSAKFQTFSMSNVPPNWTNSHSHNNFWITPAPGDQERWAAWMIFQWGVSWSSLALCHSFYKDTIDLWADQTPLPAKLISAVTLDIREHLWKFSLSIARGIAKASPHQSKLCVMPSCNLISIGHCWSDSLPPPPQYCLGHQTLSKSNIIERSSGYCQTMDKIKAPHTAELSSWSRSFL